MHSYISSHDDLLTKVLLWIEELGRRSFQPADLIDLSDDLELQTADVIEAKNMLYTMLCSFTTGPVKASVRRFRPQGCLRGVSKIAR